MLIGSYHHNIKYAVLENLVQCHKRLSETADAKAVMKFTEWLLKILNYGFKEVDQFVMADPIEKSTPDVQDQERLERDRVADELQKEIVKRTAETFDDERLLVYKPALFCLARHFKTFYTQACAGVKANFTLPCVDCPKMTTCDKHWDDYILPLCDKAGVKVLFNSDIRRR